MNVFGRKARTPTDQSVDVDTTFHGACKYCHHWHNASTLHLHFSRDGHCQNNITCSNCGRSYAALGGRQPRFSFLSQLTLRDEPGETRFGTVIDSREDGSANISSTLIFRIQSLFRSLISGQASSSLSEPSRGNDGSEAPNRQAAYTGGTAQRPAATSSICDQSPESLSIIAEMQDNEDASPISMRSSKRLGVHRFVSNVQGSTQQLLMRIKTQFFRLRWKRASVLDAHVDKTTLVAVNAAESSDAVRLEPDIQATDTLQARSSRGRQIDKKAKENKLCADCQDFVHRERKQITLDKINRLVLECPRSCCRINDEDSERDDDHWSCGSRRNLPHPGSSALLTRQIGSWADEAACPYASIDGALSLESGSVGTMITDGENSSRRLSYDETLG